MNPTVAYAFMIATVMLLFMIGCGQLKHNRAMRRMMQDKVLAEHRETVARHDAEAWVPARPVLRAVGGRDG